MSQFDSNKDYYGVLGVDKDASQIEIDRQYKRQAAKHHPDRGGNEERMKSLNEAYGVLKDKSLRSSYDAGRRPTAGNSARLCSGHDSDGARRRSSWSLPERVALLDRGYVFAAAGAVSVDLVSVAARDSGAVGAWIRSHAGAQRDGCGECVAAGDKSV